MYIYTHNYTYIILTQTYGYEYNEVNKNQPFHWDIFLCVTKTWFSWEGPPKMRDVAPIHSCVKRNIYHTVVILTHPCGYLGFKATSNKHWPHTLIILILGLSKCFSGGRYRITWPMTSGSTLNSWAHPSWGRWLCRPLCSLSTGTIFPALWAACSECSWSGRAADFPVRKTFTECSNYWIDPGTSNSMKFNVFTANLRLRTNKCFNVPSGNQPGSLDNPFTVAQWFKCLSCQFTLICI
jgi:hypothetical protein